MTEAMPFLQKYDITFLRPPTIRRGLYIQKVQALFCVALRFAPCGRAALSVGFAAASPVIQHWIPGDLGSPAGRAVTAGD